MTSFCTPEELLVGDMPTNHSRAQQFVDAAADEMATRLMGIYVWPPAEPLEERTELVLKRINVLIATGRYVMAQAVGSEDMSTHAYGTYMLREGQTLLQQVMDQEIVLPGVDFMTAYDLTSGNAPRVINEDTYSAFARFYEFADPWNMVAYQWGPNK